MKVAGIERDCAEDSLSWGRSRRGGPLNRGRVTARAGVIWLFLAAGVGRAGPPFFTDDPVPLGLHHWEVYLASQDFVTRDLVSGTLPHLEVNYGVTGEVMFHAIMPMAFSRPASKAFQYGPGDIELGIKCRFLRETRSRPQIGTFPHVQVPVGSESRGLGNGRAQVFLPLWVQKSWGPWTSYGGGGYWINPGPGNTGFWMFGWEVQRDLSEKVTVGAELIRNTPDSVGSTGETAFNLGTLITIGDGKIIMFSAGRDIHGENTFFAYVALYWTWGP
jgi:hypothetical protein